MPFERESAMAEDLRIPDDDIEKQDEDASRPSGSREFGYRGQGSEPIYDDDRDVTKQSFGRRFLNSFKQDHSKHATPSGVIGANGRVFDPHSAALGTATSPLARKLKGRHLQMIAIGGSIGIASNPSVLNESMLRSP
jgi:amino acid transporter